MDDIEINTKFSESVKKLTNMYSSRAADIELENITVCFRKLYAEYAGEKKMIESKDNKTEELAKKNKLRADEIEEKLKTLK